MVVGIWVQWMAPTSLRRLEHPTRLIVQIMLFVTVALYAAAGGLLVPGIVFAVISIAVFTAIVAPRRLTRHSGSAQAALGTPAPRRRSGR